MNGDVYFGASPFYGLKLTHSSRCMFLLLGEIPWPLVSLGLVGVSVTTTKYNVDLKQLGASKKSLITIWRLIGIRRSSAP